LLKIFDPSGVKRFASIDEELSYFKMLMVKQKSSRDAIQKESNTEIRENLVNAITLLGRQISVEHIAFTPRRDSNMVDPRTKIPARLRSGKAAAAKPAFDSGSASSTDED
jgi:hypothetical protein